MSTMSYSTGQLLEQLGLAERDPAARSSGDLPRGQHAEAPEAHGWGERGPAGPPSRSALWSGRRAPSRSTQRRRAWFTAGQVCSSWGTCQARRQHDGDVSALDRPHRSLAAARRVAATSRCRRRARGLPLRAAITHRQVHCRSGADLDDDAG
jgi:hypothetical protein